jgi:hypothetical protein
MLPPSRKAAGCGVIDKSDEYRRNAEYCQRMANWTHNEAEKRAWLSLAQSWVNMIRQSPDESKSSR